ncbi:glycosyltransferase [Microvirga sp. VF16]|uniref:glycosyltransferase n=1 Tax=Microvirga sp. VF16 TaxID=2807101 RepID=UPI00193CEAD3|nr:glycosyltransferase [Microvirga sp. VF16]QRM28268.1 glycosyltransferase [Microvirga sp. VF16]
MKMGHQPAQVFENVRYLDRANIPQEHLYRVTASPVLCRVPPTRFLAPYQIKTRLHKHYNTFEEYCHRAMTLPDAIGSELWESDLRVVAYMDNNKKKLARDYSTLPQDTLISIIMPTRNRAAVIADAIVSVLMQSYKNWELIVADDASDNSETEALIKQFGDDRIKYVRLAEQLGVGGARNTGIEHSSGRVIAYLGDEDQWDPDFLLILLNQMRSQRARIAYCAHVMWEKFDPDARLGRTFKGVRFAPFNRPLLENTNYIAPVTLVHERDLLDEIGPFDASLKQHGGWDLVLRMTEVAQPIAVPCLLGHSFQAKAEEDENIAAADQAKADETLSTAGQAKADENIAAGSQTEPTDNASAARDDADALKAVQLRLVERSAWTQPFTTMDEKEHLAFSIGQRSRDLRQTKLSRLPVEPVQIVIPNYESASELEVCLRSIAEHTPTPYHVVIVDNGSSEETYAQLEKLPTLFENVRLIKEDKHSGFSFAVNRGLAEVVDRDEKILILNNDTLATPDWLDELRYVLFKHADAGMAVPRQTLPANSKASKVHIPGAVSAIECDINLSAHHNNIIDLEFDREDGFVELTYAPLFCGLVRPETMRAAGGLDSGNGPHYRSDWILCDFIRRHMNQRIIYTPHSKVYHLQGVATQKRKSSDEGFLASLPSKSRPLEPRNIIRQQQLSQGSDTASLNQNVPQSPHSG